MVTISKVAKDHFCCCDLEKATQGIDWQNGGLQDDVSWPGDP